MRDSARALQKGDGRNHVQLTHVGKQLNALLGEMRAQLRGAEPEEAEFSRLFPHEEKIFWRDAEPRASALAGWIRGAVDAAILSVRIEAEARAYAEQRLKEERGIGFKPRGDS
jgi:hypothetical protein